MKFNLDSFKYLFGRRMEWLGSKEDFLEFVIMVANLRTSKSIFDGYPDDRVAFDSLCDSMGSELLRVFRPDISPYRSFAELRRNVTPSFAFTREIIGVILKSREERDVYRMLDRRGITPSRETMHKINRDWKEAEDLARYLCPLLNIQ